MKNLANCNPIEFLVQTNKIRKSVETWLKSTNVIEIIRRRETIPENLTKEEMIAIRTKQIKKKASDLLDACLEKYPKETAELLGLVCFVEPEDLENHKMTEFLGSFGEIIESPEVISFFTSFTNLVEKVT